MSIEATDGVVDEPDRDGTLDAARRPALDAWTAAALGVALLVRVVGLTSQSVTMDEIGDFDYARGLEGDGRLLQADDGFPPLYNLLTRGLHDLGASLQDVRWLSVVFGMVTVLATWGAARWWVGREAARWVVWVAALAPLAIWYSQEARVYSPFLCFVAVAIYAMGWALQTGKTQAWALFVLAGAALAYTHYLAGLLFGFTLVGGWLLTSGERRRQLLTAHAALFVLSLPVLLVAEPDLSKQVPEQVKILFDLEGFVYTYYTLVNSFTLGPSLNDLRDPDLGEVFVQALPWVLLGGTLVLVTTVAALRALPRDRRLWFASLVLLPVGVCGLVTLAADVAYRVRYAAWVVIPLVILVGTGLSVLPRRAAAAMVAIGLVISGISIGNRLVNDRYANEDSKSTAAWIERNVPEDEPVMALAGYMAPAINYYLPESGRQVLETPDLSTSNDEDADPEGALEAWTASGRSWLIYTRPFHVDPDGELFESLDEIREVRKVADFAGIEVFEVLPPD